MNCASLTRLFDERGSTWLTDERLLAAADAHCDECSDCRAALTGVRALAHDPVPAPALLGRRIARLSLDGAAQPKRAPRVALAAAVAFGGVAFAGAGWYAVATFQPDGAGRAGSSVPPSALADDGSEGVSVFSQPLPARDDAASEIARYVATEESRRVEAWSASILGALPDGEYFALLQVPPVYPAAAAERGIEGEAVAEFTITSVGDVEDVTIIRSSDPVFDGPTIDATLRKKYKPRVVDGRGVAVTGVRTVYRYELRPTESLPDEDTTGNGNPPTRRETEAVPEDQSSDLDNAQFANVLAAANDCLEAGDLRCMELELDRVMATYQLSTVQTSRLWHFYGFLHHRRGRYELAIEAYRNAARPAADDPTYMNVFPLMIVAYIHYELGQYQEAMNAASDYVRLTPNPQAVNYVFIDRLKSLGAIEPVRE